VGAIDDETTRGREACLSFPQDAQVPDKRVIFVTAASQGCIRDHNIMIDTSALEL
jgi:hypothetical protein